MKNNSNRVLILEYKKVMRKNLLLIQKLNMASNHLKMHLLVKIIHWKIMKKIIQLNNNNY